MGRLRLIFLTIFFQCLASTAAQGFETGDRVLIESLGITAGSRWLDGRTVERAVGLAPSFGAPYTGTLWELTKVRDREFLLKTLGDIEGPRWLDGNTIDGTVGLAPSTDPQFSGTHWELFEVAPGEYTFRCLGTVEGPRWLDGRTADGTVGLAPTTSEPFSGTRWRVRQQRPVHVLTQHNDNARTGGNLNETLLEPRSLQAGRFGHLFDRVVDGQIYAQPLYVNDLILPGKGRHNVIFVATTLNYVYAFDAEDPAQNAPLWRSRQLGIPVPRANIAPGLRPLIDPAVGITSTPVIDLATRTMYVVAKSKTIEPLRSVNELKDGDRVLIECLGTTPGSRWLDGITDQSRVALQDNTELPFTGTVWMVHRPDVSGDVVTLETLGASVDLPPPARFLDGRTRDPSVGLAPNTGPDFSGTSWRLHQLAPGEIGFENQGEFDGPRWLDGITAAAAVSLAPSTGGIFTGTHWRIHRLVMHQRLYALDIATGEVKLHPPPGRHEQVVEIEGMSSSGKRFDPAQHLNRPGLLLQDNTIYVAFGAHADFPPWQGWVFAYDATTLRPFAPYLVRASGDGGGIWQAGNGLVGDETGSVYFMTGNRSPFDREASPPDDARNSFVKLRRTSNALIEVDRFTPPNRERLLDPCDVDLGSAGPVLLPGTNQLAGAGKEGMLYLIDTARMRPAVQVVQVAVNQFGETPRTCPSPTDTNLEERLLVVRTYPHVHGSPIVWPLAPPAMQILYVWAEQDVLKALTYEGGRFAFAPIQSTLPAPQDSMPGGVLSLSADGATPGSGIVWATRPLNCRSDEPPGPENEVARSCNAEEHPAPAGLFAYHALTLEALWDSERNADDYLGKHNADDHLGNLGKFAPATVAHGRVYVATFAEKQDCSADACPSKLVVYGVLPRR